jgi:hypothetical protein
VELVCAAHLAREATQVCQKMSLEIVLLRGDTSRSSIHGAQQTEIDSETSHDQSVRKSVGSSMRGSRSTALQRRMPWPQGCSSINSPHTHVKCLQAMLDTTTVVDLALDRDDEAQRHEHDHRQSPHGDLASSLTPLEERGQR